MEQRVDSSVYHEFSDKQTMEGNKISSISSSSTNPWFYNQNMRKNVVDDRLMAIGSPKYSVPTMFPFEKIFTLNNSIFNSSLFHFQKYILPLDFFHLRYKYFLVLNIHTFGAFLQPLIP